MRWLALLAFLPSLAWAQQYLPQADYATCLARSAAQCQALGCQPGTTYWWNCQKLTDGTAAVQTQPGTMFDATTTNAVAKSPVGLSGTEQSALQSRAQLGTKLPDIIASTVWLSRISTAKQNAITTWATNHPGIAATIWNAIKGGANVDLQDARVQALIAAGQAAGVFSDADVASLNTQQATAAQ